MAVGGMALTLLGAHGRWPMIKPVEESYKIDPIHN
jgi:hypothetical protein